MKRWGVASIIMVAMFGAYLSFKLQSARVEAIFRMNAGNTEGTFTVPTPVQGQACLLEDLNMRNDRVPDVAERYSDFENRHRVVALDASGAAVMFIDIASHRSADGQQPVSAKSYCEAKRTDDPIVLRIRRDILLTGWSLTLN